jgi:hypothetical protein
MANRLKIICEIPVIGGLFLAAMRSELKPTDSSKTGKNLTADLNRLTTTEKTAMVRVLR